jgi:hypothetical protein
MRNTHTVTSDCETALAVSPTSHCGTTYTTSIFIGFQLIGEHLG